MSMVNADSVQLFAMLKKMQDSISSIETTKKSVKMKYEQLGAGWQDKKYRIKSYKYIKLYSLKKKI